MQAVYCTRFGDPDVPRVVKRMAFRNFAPAVKSLLVEVIGQYERLITLRSRRDYARRG